MKHWPNWQQVVAGLGFDVSEHMGKSRQAVVAKGGDASDSEQEHWFSTEALLSLLVHWSLNRISLGVSATLCDFESADPLLLEA